MQSSASALQPWLERVEALAPRIREARSAADRDCRLPWALVQDLAAAGLFRMWLPSELGGFDVAPVVSLRVIERAARIDGSTGWCLGPGNVSSLFAAYLPEPAARDVYGGDWAVNAAGSLAGMGRAEPVAEGFRLTGRWSFCTNSHGCPWYLGIFTVMDGDAPRSLDGGGPDLRFFYFPADRAEIVPTWDTGGLRGTGSNDLVLEEAVVGADYGFGLTAEAWAAAPMYGGNVKLWPPAAFAAVALGIAEASVEALAELATTRVPTLGVAAMRENPVLRAELGRADASLRAARLLFFDAVDRCYAALEGGDPPTREQATRLGQACAHVADTSREVTQTMYRLGGGASVYKSSPLDGCLRDAHVAAQHSAIGPRRFDDAARVMLGMAAA